MAGVSWATYTYDTDKSEWRALDLAEALVALAQRYGRPATGENPDVVAGKTFFVQQLYRTLHDGVATIVQQGNIPMTPGAEKDDPQGGPHEHL